jgi:hypothetical protein
MKDVPTKSAQSLFQGIAGQLLGPVVKTGQGYLKSGSLPVGAASWPQ